MAFACPCCGYRTLLDRPGDSLQLCEVCMWETGSPSAWAGDPAYGLAAAQRMFRECGACDRAFVELTRAPRADEARPAWWLSLDDAPAVLVALIEAAFADVTLAGGVSLAEAELIDDYALPARTENDPPPRGYGDGPRWQDLTLAELDRYPWGNFSFQDARGIRYHAPAFMRAHLREPECPGAIDSLLFALDSGHQLEALDRLLTEPQRHAIARYLAFLAISPTWHDLHARKALKKRWAAHLDDDHRNHVG